MQAFGGHSWRKPQPGTFTVFVHCSDSEGCLRNRVSNELPTLTQVPTTPTWYCHDLVTAMTALLRGALVANSAGPIVREKFVFVSESTLPAKPFVNMCSTLMEDDDSDFCVFPSNQWGTARIDGHQVDLVKHHQWVVLNRQHADFFVRQWVPVDARSVWHVWLRDSSWVGRERYVSPQHFYHPPLSNWCADEWAFMATIFGALEPQTGVRSLPGFGGGPLNMHKHTLASATSQGRCRTFVYWDNYGDAGAVLASSIFHDHDSRMSCFPRCSPRPAGLQQLSGSALKAIRASPFLFVRKVEPTALMPNFEKVVLG
eukprot:TRINITY_DN14022_c0_g3_i1.p1 TRINITY_DN14022_c0_g3~~TRINITY_DN14022_c0_g3_i1.p1  ORF type:complete len:314 (+),score=23.07 TRINITY_DN14022_c0_g3_i1:407-1348(+)